MAVDIKEREWNSIGLFRNVSRDQRACLLPHLQRRSARAGTILLAKGQTGSGVFFLLQGAVKVCSPMKGAVGDRDVILAICGPGEVLGEIDALTAQGHTASVVTLEQSHLFWIPTKVFCDCLQQVPLLSNNLNQILITRLSQLSANECARAKLDLEGRLARHLLLISRKCGIEIVEGTLLPLRLRQRELAALIGSTRERVNEKMCHFKRGGLLALNAQGYLILRDPQALAQRCAQCLD